MARRVTGSCPACGYSPVAVDARACPRCGARNPNPGVANRFVGRGMLYGLGAGGIVGAVAGLYSDRPGMVIGGALLGAIPGLFAGMLVGLVAAAVSAFSRGNPPSRGGRAAGAAGEQDQPENVFVQFTVDGFGTDADLDLCDRVERVLDAELRSFRGGRCGGSDMGSGKATVFLVVRDPARAMPRLLNAIRREGLLLSHLVVAEDTGAGHKVWWPKSDRGNFSLL